MVILTGHSLNLNEIKDVLYHNHPVTIAPESLDRLTPAGRL
jgi:histidine ammonia-lyase